MSFPRLSLSLSFIPPIAIPTLLLPSPLTPFPLPKPKTSQQPTNTSPAPSTAKPLFKNNKCFNKVSDGRIFPRADGNVKCPRPGSASSKEIVETPADNTVFTDVAQLVQDESGKNGTTTPAPDAGKVVAEAPGEIAEGLDDATAKEKRHARDFDIQLEEYGEAEAEVKKRGRGGYN